LFICLLTLFHSPTLPATQLEHLSLNLAELGLHRALPTPESKMTPTKIMCLLLALLLAVCGARAMVVQLEVLVLTAPGGGWGICRAISRAQAINAVCLHAGM
jgi:hypothetical protein